MYLAVNRQGEAVCLVARMSVRVIVPCTQITRTSLRLIVLPGTEPGFSYSLVSTSFKSGETSYPDSAD